MDRMPFRVRYNHLRATAIGPGLNLLRISSDCVMYVKLFNLSGEF
jgi:hypothetical protein